MSPRVVHGSFKEQDFAEAEAYEAKWREEDKERYRQERLP
jgi:hypothetical protein